MWTELNTEQLVRNLSTVILVDALGPPYFENVHKLAATVLPDKSAWIVVYGNGSSSNATIVLQQLSLLGYRQLALYLDGTEGWIEAGLPIE